MRRGPPLACLALVLACDPDGDRLVPPAHAPEDRTVAPARSPDLRDSLEPTTPAAPPLAPSPAPEDIPAEPAPADLPSPRGPLELAFVGDIILGKYVLNDYASLVDGDDDPFARVRDLLSADLLVGNLETPLVRQLVTVERAGWRIGLVAATTYINTSAGPDAPALPLYRTRDLPRSLLPHLAAARDSHDLLIVLLHWGQEFMTDPDDFQRVAARRLLDGGADLVVGHHPHVLQGIERHAHGLVAYSLGNFLFANTDERSRHSGVLRLRYEPGRRCPTRASFHPVWLGPPPTHRPEPAQAPAPEILAQVQKASRRLRTPWQKQPAQLVLTDFPACDAAAERG